MAHSFTSAAFAISVTHEEAALLDECSDVSDLLRSEQPGDHESDIGVVKAAWSDRSPAFKATFPPIEGEENPFASFLRCWSDPNHPAFSVNLCAEDDPDKDRMLVHIGSSEADTRALANVIQKVCVSALPFGFEWAMASMCANPGAYGGGYFLITRDEIVGGTTGYLMGKALDALNADDGSPPDDDPVETPKAAAYVVALADEVDGLLFWNNVDGFGSLDTAMVFTEAEARSGDPEIPGTQ